MWRPLVGAVAGVVAGVAVTALLLRGTFGFVGRTEEKIFEIDRWVYYVTVVVGAGFGALCGTLTGLTAALVREWRRSRTP